MTVDTEEEWDWDAGWPTSEPSVSNIDELPKFHEICQRYGVAPTYFTNHAVLANARSRDTLLHMVERGHAEVGMHIHPWNTPPIVDSDQVTARETFLHNLPQNLIEAKLAAVVEKFHEYGLFPTSFRGGRYSSDDLIQNYLRDRGMLVDASVVPYTRWKDDGAPDYRRRGNRPVRLPPRHAGDAPFWQVPLTLAYSRRPPALWRWCYEKVETTPLRHLRLIGIAERLGVVQRMWLNFEYESGATMLSFLHKLRPMRLETICMTIHSSSMVPGKSPFVRTPEEQKRMYAGMELVFRELASWPDVELVTMSEAAEKLEEHYLARSRNQPVR
jgi:hypothetical protein